LERRKDAQKIIEALLRLMDIPRLHPDTIEEVKQRLDIVDVISEYVVLRKRGKDYIGLCPFHEEKTPSFSVNPSKQFYYCFGCGAGGNTFKFLMELGKQSFSQVVLDLAKRYQVPIKTLAPEQKQELQRQLSLREQLYEILALTASFYQHALRQPQGEIALNYLKNERQLGEETIGQFQLGYAPAGWETLYRYLVEQKRYPTGLVAEAGLIKARQEGKGYYDYFRHRLMIPIQDIQGRIIGFGSRSLGADEPKYLNSPETPLFDKSKTLFALDKAKQSISKQDRALVVEGYFDAIALHCRGISNAVASLGTAFSQEQLRQILRYTQSKEVILNFDADRAGIQATQRAISDIESLIYSGQVQLRILTLPEGKDADEFLKSHTNAVEKYREIFNNAPLWLDWEIKQLLQDRDLNQANQFQQVCQNMVKLLVKIENSDLRTHYLGYCANLLSQGDSRLISFHINSLVAQLKKPSLTKKSPSSSPILPIILDKNLLEQAEYVLLLIYLHCPEYRQEITEKLEEKDLMFSFSHHRFLWQQISQIKDTEFSASPDSNRLISLLQDRYLEFPEHLEKVKHLFHLSEAKQWEDISRAPIVIQTTLAALERVSWEKYQRYCLEQWQKLDPSTEAEKMQYYYQELQGAKEKIKELDLLRCH
jgi:DNA primase